MARFTDEQLQAKLSELTMIEREHWLLGDTVAGIDEVGRGPLAGPVMTACVMIPADKLVLGVNDSKRLTSRTRERLYPLLCEAADFVGIGRVEPDIIDDINILEATRLAMNQAAVGCTADVFLVDSVDKLNLPGPSRAMVHGDQLSYMIGAASIIAKVTRDALMLEYDALYPQYGFARNKGYGTPEHIAALQKYGPCPIHRRGFIARILEGDTHGDF